jgi:F-type H+-transporting ATPase subunit alpha
MFSLLSQEFYNNHTELELEEIGIVASLGDGVAQVVGLTKAMMGEKVIFESDSEKDNEDPVVGWVMRLKKEAVGVVILGQTHRVSVNTRVKRTKMVFEVPIGPELLGRVVNALGQPIDDLGPIYTKFHGPIERSARGIMERQSIHEPLHTGIKALDALCPIGKGQRELIIGDRQTGKTTLALDALINQKESHKKMLPDRVYGIYVAIGQKQSTIAHIVQTLKSLDVMAYTTVVVASASEAAALQFLAPYSGCAMGEYYRDRGQHALIIYDDLSKHAIAYRQMSLVLKVSPGREAYPGDVFYIHSRLLERAGKLHPNMTLKDDLSHDDASFEQQSDHVLHEKKHPLTSEKHHHIRQGGSLTALPIVETQAGDISAYIPTNVISITDGQIFLDTERFFQGFRPAINVGISVSRVGGAAQWPITKLFSQSIKLELAQYREVASFAQFGADMDITTLKQIKRGSLLETMFIQKQLCPLDVIAQAVLFHAVNSGYADEIPENKIQELGNFLEIATEQGSQDLWKHLRGPFSVNENDKNKIDIWVKEQVNLFKKKIILSPLNSDENLKSLREKN